MTEEPGPDPENKISRKGKVWGQVRGGPWGAFRDGFKEDAQANPFQAQIQGCIQGLGAEFVCEVYFSRAAGPVSKIWTCRM